MKLPLAAIPGLFAVCRLGPAAAIPSWATAGEFVSITKTADELSIVCLQEQVPDDINCERDWMCLRVVGTLDFSQIGVLSSLTSPLAAAGISVFAISTFDTDYLLVNAQDFKKALEILDNSAELGGQ